ncbi:hypothetical protein HDU97_010451 [Phlyctochytrium planicorne]|nr:hypothetical protein HDU97_010451 [Phlyctochytrium planicorne]
MYIRVKRLKATYFITIEEADTVLALKSKVASTIGKGREALKDIRLSVLNKTGDAYNTLEDSGILEQLGIVDDSVVYLTLWMPGNPNAADGAWESVSVPEFEPLGEEVDMTVDDKGKGTAN